MIDLQALGNSRDSSASLRALGSLGSLGSRSSLSLAQEQPAEPTSQSPIQIQQQQSSFSGSPKPGLVRSDSINSQSGSRESLAAGGRDFLSNMSSELNGLAAQTSSMFTGLFGIYISNTFGIAVIIIRICNQRWKRTVECSATFPTLR